MKFPPFVDKYMVIKTALALYGADRVIKDYWCVYIVENAVMPLVIMSKMMRE